MQTPHQIPQNRDLGWVPTIALGWMHAILAFACAGMVLAKVGPPVLGLAGMAFFGTVAMTCVLLTITRLRA
jgi:hypothetical protein